MKRGAIFDMDGLLFDTERVYREEWTAAGVEFVGHPAPELAEAVCGTSGDSLRKTILECYPNVDAQAYIDCVLVRVRNRVREEPVRLMPGVREILSYLQDNGFRLAVASSSAREMILNNLERAQINGCFSAVVSGEDVLRGKPDPEIFQMAANWLDLKPEDCYVFEDGINGVLAGAAAGCSVVMIPDLTQPSEEARAKSTVILPSLKAAVEWIKENGQ